MPFESFNPADPKYKTSKDLPEKLQGNFQDVPGGFVRKEVVEYEGRLANRAKEESYLSKPITIEELRLKDAHSQDRAITDEVQKQIERVEKSLGAPLSEAAKQEIYNRTAPDVYLSTQERYSYHNEQGQFVNIQIEELSQEIASMSEQQLQALPSERKREILAQLAEFNRFVPDAKQAETLDSASRRLLEGYQPSSELKQLHQEVHTAVLEHFESAQLLELQFMWSHYSQEEKLTLCQQVVDYLSSAYALSEAPKVMIPSQTSKDTLEPRASFVESMEGGLVLIHAPEAVFSHFSTMASIMAHEIAHAHQKKLTNQLDGKEDGEPILKEDALWFQLDETLERTYDRQFYENNYLLMTREQDAFSTQRAIESLFEDQRRLIQKRWDGVLRGQGFPSALEMGNRSYVITNAEAALREGKVKDGNGLIKLLEDDYAVLPEDAEPLFKGKTIEECQESIQTFNATMKRAIDIFPRSKDHA